jgi:Tfp pilus assembly protein PilF
MHPDRTQRLELAVSLIDGRRYDDARRVLLDLLAEDGSNAEAISLLAFTASSTNDHQAAVESAFRAVALAPESAPVRWRAGWVLLRAKRPREARTAFEEAVRLNPSAPAWRVLLARACHAAGDTETAFVHLRAALQLDPHCGEAWNLRAVLLSIVGLQAEAKAASAEALRLMPAGSRAHMADGYVALQLGQLGKARNALRESLRLNPDDPSAATIYTYAAMYSLPLLERYMSLPLKRRRIAARIGAVLGGFILFGLALYLTDNTSTALIIAYLFAPIVGDMFGAIAVIRIASDALARNGLRPRQLSTAIWLTVNLAIAIAFIFLGRTFQNAALSAIGVICGYSAVAIAYFNRSWAAKITFPVIDQFTTLGLNVTAVTQAVSVLCALTWLGEHPRHIDDIWASTNAQLPLIDRIAGWVLAGMTVVEAALFALFVVTLMITSSYQGEKFGKARDSARV